MKDIGYYAGWLAPESTDYINTASIKDLLEDIGDISGGIRHELIHKKPHGVHQFWDGRSDPELLSLIRGLCDQIERRLMEQAE